MHYIKHTKEKNMELHLKSKRWKDDQMQVYKSKNGYRWRVISFNNLIVGASSESYKNLQDCFRNLIRAGYIITEVIVSTGKQKGVWQLVDYNNITDVVTLERTSEIATLRRKKK